MNYFYVIVLLITIKLCQEIVTRINRQQVEKVNQTKKLLSDELEPVETKLGIKKAPFLHLRMATVFSKIPGEEGDNLKKKLVEIVDQIGAKPKRKIMISIGFFMVQFFFLIGIYRFLYESPDYTLAIIGVTLTVLSLFMGKRFVLGILVGVIVYYVYTRIPATVVWYIILSTIYSLITKYIRKGRT